MSTIKNAWITLNRQCNLRCQWCYAESTNYKNTDEMSIELADKIINFLSEFQPNSVSLIGGEPTCYPYLTEVIGKIHSLGMASVLITNGVELSDKRYLDEVISAGLSGINLSLKGWSSKSYFQNTGVYAYEKVAKAIENIAKSPIDNMISFVINPDNVDFYLDAIANACKQGAQYFYLSFEHDFSILDGNNTLPNLDKIFYMIDRFMESYDKLNLITNEEFRIHLSYPLCIWDQTFIKKMLMKGQILTSCQLLDRSGLVFDTNGFLIPCNSMYQTPIGKFGEDFINKTDFELFCKTDRVRKIYKNLTSLPSFRCDTCTEQACCGGGCIGNWFYYNHSELIDSYQAWRKMNNFHYIRV